MLHEEGLVRLAERANHVHAVDRGLRGVVPLEQGEALARGEVRLRPRRLGFALTALDLGELGQELFPSNLVEGRQETLAMTLG